MLKLLKIGSILLFVILKFSLFAKDYDFKVLYEDRQRYVGEEFNIEFRFSYHDGSKIAEVNFTPPLFHNLYIKNKAKLQKPNYESWVFTLSAIKDKNVSVDSAYLDIAIKKTDKKSLGNFDEYDYDYLSFETKPFKIKIAKEAKVAKTKLFGNFDIKSRIDQKDNVTTLIIDINGSGNFYDISGFKLDLKDATVYEDKPSITKDSFKQQFVIVSQKDFIIPSFEIRYTDKKTKKIITKKTDEIIVKIKEKKQPVSTPTKKDLIPKKVDLLYLLLAFLGGIFISFIYFYFFTKKKSLKKDQKLYQKIKEAKDKKEILNILIAHPHDKKIKDLIDRLEDDLYISKENKLRKKDILKSL